MPLDKVQAITVDNCCKLELHHAPEKVGYINIKHPPMLVHPVRLLAVSHSHSVLVQQHGKARNLHNEPAQLQVQGSCRLAQRCREPIERVIPRTSCVWQAHVQVVCYAWRVTVRLHKARCTRYSRVISYFPTTISSLNGGLFRRDIVLGDHVLGQYNSPPLVLTTRSFHAKQESPM